MVKTWLKEIKDFNITNIFKSSKYIIAYNSHKGKLMNNLEIIGKSQDKLICIDRRDDMRKLGINKDGYLITIKITD